MKKVGKTILTILVITTLVLGIRRLLSHYDPRVRVGSECSIPAIATQQMLFADDFEEPSIQEFWAEPDAGSGRYEPGAVTTTNERDARNGMGYVSITLREGDVSDGHNNERAELDSGKHPFLGRTIRYQFSILIPSDFPQIENRLVIAQFKQKSYHNGPIVAQRFRGGRHYLSIRTIDRVLDGRRYFPLPDLVPEVWHDMDYLIRYATDDSGFVSVKMDGEELVRYCGPTASTQGRNSFYNKIGLYRDRWPDPMTIFFDDYRLSEVETSRAHRSPDLEPEEDATPED